MPKIKNYTPCHETFERVAYRWNHDSKQKSSVEVLRKEKKWIVLVVWGSYVKEVGEFNKKEKARKKACEWMRDNPNFWKPEDPVIDHTKQREKVDFNKLLNKD